MTVTLAVDAMGGDHGPAITVPASIAFLDITPDARVILVGVQASLDAALQTHKSTQQSRVRDRLSIHPASEVVDMNEPPADALRKKKDSSLRVAINLVKDGVADGCVSAGNTGALMAIGRFVLKTLPGIDRPAIASQLPTKRGGTTALDPGANVRRTAVQLVEVAVKGSAWGWAGGRTG